MNKSITQKMKYKQSVIKFSFCGLVNHMSQSFEIRP